MPKAWDSKIPTVIANMREAEARSVDQVGGLGQAVARAHARVRTGYMRDNIEWHPLARELRGDAPYTIYNELGTRYMSAQPMFAPAMDAMHAAVGVTFSRYFRTVT